MNQVIAYGVGLVFTIVYSLSWWYAPDIYNHFRLRRMKK